MPAHVTDKPFLKLTSMFSAWEDGPTLRVVPASSRGVDRGFLTKLAGEFPELHTLRPQPGYTYVHANAVGAFDTYGCNSNGDAFKRGDCESSHKTFVKWAKVYKDHNHCPTSPSYGYVPASYFSPTMDRIELLMAINTKTGSDFLHDLETTGFIPLSMGCKVAYDVCSVCDHKAPTQEQYCYHAKHMLSKIADDGRLVCVYNPSPLFFDISRVRRPADKIVWSFRKVASGGMIGSAELASAVGLALPEGLSGRGYLKRRLRKLASMEKRVEACAMGTPDAELDTLRMALPRDGVWVAPGPGDQASDVLGSLADIKVVLSFEDFLKLLGEGDDIPEADMAGMKEMLPGMFGRLLSEGGLSRDSVLPEKETVAAGPSPCIMAINRDEQALDPDNVQRRVRYAVLETPELGRLEVGPVVNKTASEAQNEAHKKVVATYAQYLVEASKKIGSDLVDSLIVLRNYVRD